MPVIFAKEKRALLRFLFIQCAMALLFWGISKVYFSATVALSVLLGGGLAVVPGLFLSLWFFCRNAQPARKVLRDLYIAEAVKLCLIGGLFVVMLHYFDVQLLPFLVGFCGVYAAYFIAPRIMK